MKRYLILMKAQFICDAQFVNLGEYPELLDEEGEVDWDEASSGSRSKLDIEAPMVLDVIEALTPDDAIHAYVAKDENVQPVQLQAIEVEFTQVIDLD